VGNTQKMATNINSAVRDVFYRYKMPTFSVKFEKGKTLIANIDQVAKALNRDPAYLITNYGHELGTIARLDKEKGALLNGEYTTQNLSAILNKFIKLYVLCDECDNPETNLEIHSGFVSKRCVACGHDTNLTACKLTKFILKNPPKTTCVYKKKCAPKEQVGLKFKLDLSETTEWSADDQFETDTSEAAVLERKREFAAAMRLLK
jgi:translation initiation factor 2 beta subunit (eIF-2beta)/eIF-5